MVCSQEFYKHKNLTLHNKIRYDTQHQSREIAYYVIKK